MPKFEEWTPPWGTDDEQLDTDKVKKLIYDLKVDKEVLQDKNATLTTERDNVTRERDDVKRQLDEKSREGESETDKLKREVQELKDAAAAAAKDPKDDVERLKLEVALDKGLTLVQAKRLLGTTKEELEQDADELVASFGGTGNGDNDDDDDAGDQGDVRRTPRQVRNSADPKPNASTPINVDKALESIPRY
jgi:hypothetical protein